MVDLLCRDWSSLINRQVLRGSLFFASRFSEKYLRLAFFTELLTLFLAIASLNCFQIKGSFVDAAFLFRKSLLCTSRISSLVIQGERLFFTLSVLNGVCLSITLANRCIQKSHNSFGLLCVVTRFQSIMRTSRKNSASLKFLSCRTSTVLCILERRRSMIYMLSMLYVRPTIKVKVGIPESFKVTLIHQLGSAHEWSGV